MRAIDSPLPSSGSVPLEVQKLPTPLYQQSLLKIFKLAAPLPPPHPKKEKNKQQQTNRETFPKLTVIASIPYYARPHLPIETSCLTTTIVIPSLALPFSILGLLLLPCGNSTLPSWNLPTI